MNMNSITIAFTVDEVKLLASLASDQLFRRQFIDPKMPGYKPNPAEVGFGKAIVERLRASIDQSARDTSSAVAAPAAGQGYALGTLSKRLGTNAV